MKISVLIPTYRRPEDLRKCLAALSVQTRRADEIVCVVRTGDYDSREVVREALVMLSMLRVVKVDVPGVVQAQNAGIRVATGDIIAITDDDSRPWQDWLARIEDHFLSDSLVMGVGGRDFIGGRIAGATGNRRPVGTVRWYGRVIGNHHLGTGPARFVDCLKGVNCAYRAPILKEIGFDERLRGKGAQVHWELMLGLDIRARGHRLVYDPAVGVDHFPAPRHDIDQRDIFCDEAFTDACHNEALALYSHRRGAWRAVIAFWFGVLGTRANPGFLQSLRLRLLGDRHARLKWHAARRGRLAAMKSLREQ